MVRKVLLSFMIIFVFAFVFLGLKARQMTNNLSKFDFCYIYGLKITQKQKKQIEIFMTQ